MFKILIAITFLCGCYITEIKSKSCTNLPYNLIPYCERLTESMEGYKCVYGGCRKTRLSCKDNDECLTSMNACRLTCGQTSIWPLPTGRTSISNILVTFRPSEKNMNILLKLPDGRENCKKFEDLVKGLGDEIKDYLLSYQLPAADKTKLEIELEVQGTSIQFTDQTLENYTLYVSGHAEMINVRIVGKTFFGVRHGLETLKQLIVYDEKSESLVTPVEVIITDKPDYSYRGVMVDTAANYYPIKDLKRTLDAMAMNKMNTFHWHMTDRHSFPYVSKKYPKMSVAGAYSPEMVYTWRDIKEVVEYARSRGIRVIPELGMPAPIGEGWDIFIDHRTKRNYLTCLNEHPFCSAPPCRQLDPTISGVYDVLGQLYKEFAKLFDSDLFHMGSHSLYEECWKSPQISQWKDTKEVYDLWEYFQTKSLQQLQESNKKISRVIIWGSLYLTSAQSVTKFRPSSTYKLMNCTRICY